MAVMCAIGIPLFIYLYAVGVRRLKRAEELIVSRAPLQPAPDENECDPIPLDSEELPEPEITDAPDSPGGEPDE
jgi:hypothetical protein